MAGPGPGHRHTAEFCENGAKAVTEEATLRRVERSFFVEHSIEDLREKTDYWLGQQGRITEPMVLRAGSTHYEPISWDQAFELMGGLLNGLASPDEAVFYTSGKTSNEAAFAYQLFVRAFGTNNLPDCSNMCHESTSVGAGRGDRHRQGLGQPRGHPRREADRDRRPEPRHQPPADAQRARDRQAATARRSSRSTRCARPGWSASRTRRRRAASPATAPPSPTCTCRSGSTATSRSSRRSGRCCWSGTRVDHDFVARAHRRLRGVGRARARARLGRRTTRDRSRPRRDRGGGPDVPGVRRDRRLLGDGHHPAPQRGRDGQGDRQRRAAAGQHRQARRRPVPGARPLQRPGRPDDGDLGAAARRTSSTRCRRSSASTRRASTASTPWSRSRRCATARPRSSSGWAATSSRPRPTPRSPSRRCATPT